MNARIALVLLISLPLLPACGGGGDSKKPIDGAKIFSLYCKTCHKVDAGGGPLGPPLRNLADNWDSDQLRRYVRNPNSFADTDPRLRSLKMSFRLPMPATNVKDEHLGLLVDYLLTL